MKYLFTTLNTLKSKLFAILAVLAVLLSPMVTNADLIDAGDTTIDTDAGLEWLDVTLTTGQSYNSIIGGFGGYAAQGYVHATLAQLCELWSNAGAGTPDCLSGTNSTTESISQASADLLVGLLGATWAPPFEEMNSFAGIFDAGETGIAPGFVGLGCINAGTLALCNSNTPPAPTAERLLRWILTSGDDSLVGNYLVRSAIVDADADGDGVLDNADLCSATVIPEGVPTMGYLNPNHWALTEDGNAFDFDTVIKGKGKGPNRSYTIEDTAGCSCEQIIENQELGDGHTKHGCSISAMDDWVDAVNMP